MRNGVPVHSTGYSPSVICRFIATTDAQSTGNLRTHVRKCWGEDVLHVLQVGDKAKDQTEARKKVVKGYKKNRSITAAFERTGKGKVLFSHRQHAKAETRCGHNSYQCLQTGRPGYYLPSPSTVARDVKLVFARTRTRIARMLQARGELNFATDAWTSPNHQAYVAITVHLENQGVPISILLDVMEVAEVCTYGYCRLVY
ncbi:hypothetical protein K439DRAFT_1353072 [Ramaria rubella]|nr:hypothetical protein K439DRAFT_1353072 [Ramaria rubella]